MFTELLEGVVLFLSSVSEQEKMLTVRSTITIKRALKNVRFDFFILGLVLNYIEYFIGEDERYLNLCSFAMSIFFMNNYITA